MKHNWVEITYCLTCEMEVLQFIDGEYCRCDDNFVQLETPFDEEK